MFRFGMALIIVLAGFLGGCTSSNPSSPSQALSLVGSWSGTTSDNIAGAGNIHATLAQTGTTLAGTWTSTFSNSSYNGSGTLSGSLSGSSVIVTLTPSVYGSCPYAVTATVNSSGTQLSGTYVSVTCTVAVNGTISMTKQ